MFSKRGRGGRKEKRGKGGSGREERGRTDVFHGFQPVLTSVLSRRSDFYFPIFTIFMLLIIPAFLDIREIIHRPTEIIAIIRKKKLLV